MHDARVVRSHGRVAHWLVGISATLSLMIAVGSAYGFVAYQQADSAGDIPNALPEPPQTSPGAGVPDDPCAEDVCNYLLLGSDSRAGLTAEERDAFGIRPADRGGEPCRHHHVGSHRPRPGEDHHLVLPAGSVGEHPGSGLGQDQRLVRGGCGGWGHQEGRRNGPIAHGAHHGPRAVRGPGWVPRDRGDPRRRGHVHHRGECQHPRIRGGRG